VTYLCQLIGFVSGGLIQSFLFMNLPSCSDTVRQCSGCGDQTGSGPLQIITTECSEIPPSIGGRILARRRIWIESSDNRCNVRRVYPCQRPIQGLRKHSAFSMSTAVCCVPGMLRTSEAIRLGIRPRTLYALRDAAEIEKVGRGLYRLSTTPPLSNLKSRSGPDRHSGSTRHGLPHFCACAPRTDRPGAARGRYRASQSRADPES
jgi:hypothetical protein